MSPSSERQERVLEALSQCVVWHPGFVRAHQMAHKSINTSRDRRAATSMMLLGKTGVGKSTLCKRIAREVGLVETEQDTECSLTLIKPCLLVDVPPEATIKSLAVKFLGHLGLKDSERLEHFSNATLTRLIIERLLVMQTQLIILDEFHRILDQGQTPTKKKVCRWVNELLIETNIPIMLVGLPRIKKLIETIEELDDRYPYCATLRYFDFTDRAATAQFHKMIEAIEHKVIEPAGFTERIVLTHETIFKAICLVTSGNLRNLNTLLNDSLTPALSREGNTFTLEDLACAADFHKFCPPQNPFRLSVTELNAAWRKQYEGTLLPTQAS
ncbi:TniB family NTP-binding protein [Pseudomonas sp. C2B4]|uniref:TniB family NTP-binding protein n=1 Tax=Pseudomonas sp. C2B4 TaxID=2735270 RepID=UPI001585DEDB|nr:TniB family NTP-binding protein [Pseudomonas sp. C2B4]NUU39019.1 AAA family ATPase [Pseudomonas sp. C2B4]